ncbi:ankyrin-3 [Elysia marginata]|uniref:Ankyrin-3 n=1 Tax=Elysia marginata TaxID=1093978 RepID=A0AAV4IMY8_9GAST|nr:ankyrin-3 [Elysia marginata]
MSILKIIARSVIFQRHHKHILRKQLPALIYFTADVVPSPSVAPIVSALISALSCRNTIEAVHIINDEGFSAMHLAALDGNIKAAKRLLKLGEDPKQQSLDGNTPLSLSIACCHSSFSEFILPLSNVNSKDEDGDTSLMFAAWRRDVSLVTRLLNAGAEVNAVSRHGSTALWNAVYRESPEVAFVLLKANADMTACCVGTRLFLDDGDTCAEGRTVKKIYPPTPRSLLWVAVNGIDGVHKKQKLLTIVGLLLENGYHFKHDQWIGNSEIQLGLRPVKSKDIPSGVLKDKNLQTVLQTLYKKPLFLRDICRNHVRSIHMRHCLNIPYKRWVSSLKLNKITSDFLKFNYVKI